MPSTASSRPTPTATTSWSTPTSRGRGSGCGSTPCGSSGSARGRPSFRSLADYLAPVGSGIADHLGAFALTAGLGADEIAAKFKADHDDYNEIMTKALADRLAEAFAELLHERARREWGFGRAESLSKDDLIAEQYRGIRPAPGYPACPDHTEKRILWDLLDVEAATGIRLTENFAMHPAASVSGFYFAHQEARYFAVDMITRDQVEDYAAASGCRSRRSSAGSRPTWVMTLHDPGIARWNPGHLQRM